MLGAPAACECFTHRIGVACRLTQVDIEQIDERILEMLAIEGAVDEHRAPAPGVIDQCADHPEIQEAPRTRDLKVIALTKAIKDRKTSRNQDRTRLTQAPVRIAP